MLLFLNKNRILAVTLGPLLLLTGCQPFSTTRSESAEPLPPTPAVSVVAEVAPVVEVVEQPAGFCDAPRDLWSRIRDGFALPHVDHPRVADELAWYARHQGYLDRVADRAEPYLHLIVEKIAERGLPMELALLPVVESAFQPFAYSHGRAAGLWQFVPGTGRRFGLRQSWWYDGRRDVAAATDAALDYLEYLNRHFDGDWMLALAAYNSGEGTVGRAIRKNRKRGKPTDYWSLDLPPETRGYVPKLIGIAKLVDNPGAQGVDLTSINDAPFLTQIDIGSQIDLDLAAELADLEVEDIYLYNPGFNRWATDPKGPHKLLIPIKNSETFLANLEAYPESKRISWKRYRIRSGDTLSVIAERHRTTSALIKKVNRLRGHTIRAGRELIIPVARTDLKRYRLSSRERLNRVKNTPRSGTRIDYLVQEGDTLWDIAREYKVGVRSLAKWNGMAPRDPLVPGRKLVIWSQAELDQTSAINPANFNHPFEQTTTRRIGYTVRNGDSLARISQRFRVPLAKLKRWNNLNGQRYLQPGQRLTLYVDVTRQSGNI